MPLNAEKARASGLLNIVARDMLLIAFSMQEWYYNVVIT